MSNDVLLGLGLRAPNSGPAVLIYDIETAPGLAWVWGAYDQNVISMESDWYMLSFAYKWLGQRGTDYVGLNNDPAFYPDTTNDKYVVERLAALFDRADVIVAHNGDRFDRRKANARFLFNDIDPPSPYQTVDTKKISAREFAHFKNSLADLGRVHNLGGKTSHTGFELWRECMRGNPKFWKTMEKYNRQDVNLLEKVYLKLLPWAGAPGKPATPNMGFWSDEVTCPKCGGKKLHKRGIHRTSASEFQTYQCQSCRGYSREPRRNNNTAALR